MLGFSPAFTRPGMWPKHCVASMYQRTGCEDKKRQKPGRGWQWMSRGLGGKNEMEREGLQELRRRKGEVGHAGSGSRGLGSWGHALPGPGSLAWSPYFSAASKHLWTTTGDVCLLSPPSCVILREVTQLCCELQQGRGVLWLQGSHALPASQAVVTLIPPPSQGKKEGGFSTERIASQNQQLSIYHLGNKGMDDIYHSLNE